jgi:hypothetical protein
MDDDVGAMKKRGRVKRRKEGVVNEDEWVRGV